MLSVLWLQVLDAGEFAAAAIATDGALAIMADELESSGGITFARRDVFGSQNHAEHSGANSDGACNSNKALKNGSSKALNSQVTALAHVPVKAVKAQQKSNRRAGNSLAESEQPHRRNLYKAGLATLGRSFATFSATLLSLDVRGLPIFAGSPAASGALVSSLGELSALTSLNLSATSLGEGMQSYAKARRAALGGRKFTEASSKKVLCLNNEDRVRNGVKQGGRHVMSAFDTEPARAHMNENVSSKAEKLQNARQREVGAVCEGLEGSEQDWMSLSAGANASKFLMHISRDGSMHEDGDHDWPVQSLNSSKEAVGCTHVDTPSHSRSSSIATAAAEAPSAPVSTGATAPASKESSATAEGGEQKHELMDVAVSSAVDACIAAATERAKKQESVATSVLSAHAALQSVAEEETPKCAPKQQSDREASAASSGTVIVHGGHALSNSCASSDLHDDHDDFVPDSELLPGGDSGKVCTPTPASQEKRPSKQEVSSMHDQLHRCPGSDSLQSTTTANQKLPEASSKKIQDSFSQEDLRTAAKAPLSAFLTRLLSLRQLDLSCNGLGSLKSEVTYPEVEVVEGGADVAACVLPVLKMLGEHIGAVAGLQELNLRSNGLARAVLPVLEESMPKLDSLQALDVGNNRISGAVLNVAADCIASAGVCTASLVLCSCCLHA